jgi:polypeptide N-acetylgalactosaminyltransferase
MVCTRKTKTLVSTCVILSGMTNIICLLYVGWVTNYIASVYVRGQEPAPDKKLDEDKGDTLKIIERLDHLENVIKQHIQGTGALGNLGRPRGPGVPGTARGALGLERVNPSDRGALGPQMLGGGGSGGGDSVYAFACVWDRQCLQPCALPQGTCVCAGLHARV